MMKKFLRLGCNGQRLGGGGLFSQILPRWFPSRPPPASLPIQIPPIQVLPLLYLFAFYLFNKSDYLGRKEKKLKIFFCNCTVILCKWENPKNSITWEIFVHILTWNTLKLIYLQMCIGECLLILCVSQATLVHLLPIEIPPIDVLSSLLLFHISLSLKAK